MGLPPLYSRLPRLRQGDRLRGKGSIWQNFTAHLGLLAMILRTGHADRFSEREKEKPLRETLEGVLVGETI